MLSFILRVIHRDTATIWGGYSRVCRIVGGHFFVLESVAYTIKAVVLLLTFGGVVTDFLGVLLLTDDDSFTVKA